MSLVIEKCMPLGGWYVLWNVFLAALVIVHQVWVFGLNPFLLPFRLVVTFLGTPTIFGFLISLCLWGKKYTWPKTMVRVLNIIFLSFFIIASILAYVIMYVAKGPVCDWAGKTIDKHEVTHESFKDGADVTKKCQAYCDVAFATAWIAYLYIPIWIYFCCVMRIYVNRLDE